MSDLGPPRRSPRKRKAIAVINPTSSEDEEPRTKQRKPAAASFSSPHTNSPPKKPVIEKRPKRYRDHPPQSVRERMARCRTQPMFVLDRERADRPDGSLREVFKMAGSTGNVYTVVIEDVPNCDCPDGQKNGTCKHILYTMMKALHAREDLVYQAGLLQSVSLSEVPVWVLDRGWGVNTTGL